MSERIPTVKLTFTEWTNIVLLLVTELGEENVKNVLRRALGEERANRLIEEKKGPRLSKDDNRAIVREAWDLIPGADKEAKMDWCILKGRAAFDTDERFLEVVRYSRARVEEDEAAGGTIDNAPPAKTWRRDLSVVQAKDESVEFWTRGLSQPIGDGRNADGGFEWIIARVTGKGFERLLIMVMGGDRPPQRIFFDGDFTNAGFSIPMLEEAHWKVESRGGTMTIYLNGKSIWSKSGNYQVEAAWMNGYPKRHSTGEWREH